MPDNFTCCLTHKVFSYSDQEPNNMDVDEHDFDIITSADLSNDRRNGQKLEEPPISGGTEDIVDSDGYMVVTDYQRDKQGFQSLHTAF
jgi:hypothetical protein